MQPHNVENPRPGPGNDNDPKRRGWTTTFWLMMVMIGLLAAIAVNLLGRL